MGSAGEAVCAAGGGDCWSNREQRGRSAARLRFARNPKLRMRIKPRGSRCRRKRRRNSSTGRVTSRFHVLAAAEERQYFALAAKHRDLYDLGRLMLNQGMRPEEVVALRKLDVDLELGQLQIGA